MKYKILYHMMKRVKSSLSGGADEDLTEEEKKNIQQYIILGNHQDLRSLVSKKGGDKII